MKSVKSCFSDRPRSFNDDNDDMLEQFLGKWKQVSCENYEELLKKLGVNLMLRKSATQFKTDLKVEKLDNNEYRIKSKTRSTIKISHEVKFQLGVEVEEETLDLRRLLTVFTLHTNGTRLVQTQRDRDNNIVCVIAREVMANGQLKAVISYLYYIVY